MNILLAAKCGEELRATHVACLTCGVAQHVILSPENPEEKQNALCPFVGQALALALPDFL